MGNFWLADLLNGSRFAKFFLVCTYNEITEDLPVDLPKFSIPFIHQ